MWSSGWSLCALLLVVCGEHGRAMRGHEYPVSFATHMFVVKRVYRRWWEYCGWIVQWRTGVNLY